MQESHTQNSIDLDISSKDYTYLFRSGDMLNLMDAKTFEQIEVPVHLADVGIHYLTGT